jgi:hypothetical protein
VQYVAFGFLGLRPPQPDQHREKDGSSFHGEPVNVKGPVIPRRQALLAKPQRRKEMPLSLCIAIHEDLCGARRLPSFAR